ncbi:hypothetical protein BTUL_0013g00740 [Botrytis tulipae]|uniref:Uncharacterized protein n=1 Tax=Botrytis tulipae TaxID=87230 RepID=A0A4Z1F3F3_9HELO|nr:hypothetical protein BTUL_0013g00740 [Botrytis tulipae]
MAGQDSREYFDYFLTPHLGRKEILDIKSLHMTLYLVLWKEFTTGSDYVTALENENQQSSRSGIRYRYAREFATNNADGSRFEKNDN